MLSKRIRAALILIANENLTAVGALLKRLAGLIFRSVSISRRC
jgi:hypothetical protein